MPSHSQIAPDERSQVLQQYNGNIWLLHSVMHILYNELFFFMIFLVFDFKSPSTYYTSTFLVKPLYHAKLILRPFIHWSKPVLCGERAAVIFIGFTDCRHLRVHTIQKEVSSCTHKTW